MAFEEGELDENGAKGEQIRVRKGEWMRVEEGGV